MIEVTIKYSGTFVDKPNIKILHLNEKDAAAERKLANGKLEKISIGTLYDIYYAGNSYNAGKSYPYNYLQSLEETPDESLVPEHFEVWFREKHIKGKSYETRILSIDFKKI